MKKLENLKSSKETQSKLIEQMKEQEKAPGYKVDNLEGNLSVAINQVNSIRSSAQRNTLSRGAALSSANEIIAYASNFLGTPYKWGGTSPKTGFDCSGYTQYVFAHFGIKLGRTTYDQINDGVSVSKSDLKPGDLVFFGSWSDPHHMGIYIGNGAYMHAPRTGDVVKISSIERGDYVTARRVI